MTKALRVLAECVDIRTKKRFQPGDTFDPPPTEEQATRLVKAGCLPEAAIAEGKKADAAAVAKLEAAEKARLKAESDARILAAATDQVTLAQRAVTEAEAEVSAATTDAEKAAAGKKTADAKAALQRAEADLAKLTK